MEHRIRNPLLPEEGSPTVGRRLLTLKEAAAVLGLSPYSLRRLIWQGKLPAVRLTRRVQLDVRDIERLLEQAKGEARW